MTTVSRRQDNPSPRAFSPLTLEVYERREATLRRDIALHDLRSLS